MSEEHPRSSRQRYRQFVKLYKEKRLDEEAEAQEAGKRIAGAADSTIGAPPKPKPDRAKRKQYVRQYLQWLWPHRFGVIAVFVLALVVGGMEMSEPLFMRYIIDRVLLNKALDTVARLNRLHVAGLTFLFVIIASNLIKVLKDYRQRLLNTRVMLSLRETM